MLSVSSTRMSAPEGRTLSCSYTAPVPSTQQVLSKNPVNKQVEKLRPGGKNLSKALPWGQESQHQYPAVPQPVSQATPSCSSQSTQEPRPFLFTESTQFITELHFHLHTDYFKELEQVWGRGWERDRCPSGARTPSWLPQTRKGEGASGCSISGHQLSTCTRTASQQLLTHKYRHA